MSLRRLFGPCALLVAPLALLVASFSTTHAQTPSAASKPAVTPAAATLPAPEALPPVPAAHACTGGCASGSCGAAPCPFACECQKFHCPPKFVICTPKPPKLCFKCTCPKPVCDPCHLDPTGNYGYTPTCWRPWMAPPNYTCPVPSTTQLMGPCPCKDDGVPVPVPPGPEVRPAPNLETLNVLP